MINMIYSIVYTCKGTCACKLNDKDFDSLPASKVAAKTQLMYTKKCMVIVDPTFTNYRSLSLMHNI